jgi:hypothetical protein
LNPERKKKSSKQNVQAENLAAFALISERENMNEIHGKATHQLLYLEDQHVATLLLGY